MPDADEKYQQYVASAQAASSDVIPKDQWVWKEASAALAGLLGVKAPQAAAPKRGGDDDAADQRHGKQARVAQDPLGR
eukprot:4019858-Alexandrium_andersonii.AAC.1